MKKKKLPSIPALRRRLDAAFSLWIRRRDTNAQGFGHCITCRRYTDQIQCGHFIPRQHQATRWNPLNAAGQCAQPCNGWRHGAPLEFYEALCKKYGKDVVDELRRIGRTTANLRRTDLEEMIQKFSTKD